MRAQFFALDWIVLIAYFVGVMGLGLFFWKRSGSSEEFTAGGRSLPGWLCGLSIFATFLSSISYLALPGKSFVDNWNPFVFSLSIPVAAIIAIRYFMPLYRDAGEVSAYALLEKRFGVWARLYASGFYLLFQVARIGVVMYLMALPMAVIFGWDIRYVIVITGILVTAYSFVGGIVAVIWADAIQAIVLLAGAIVALYVILTGLPDPSGHEGAIGLASGMEQVIDTGRQANKFSLGDWEFFQLSEATVWVLLAYGLFENLKNFGIDQSYIQRYIASKSERDAAKSLWLSAGLYVPVSALFFFIGTSLYAWHEAYPMDTEAVRRVVAKQKLMQQGVEPEFVGRDDEESLTFSPAYEAQLSQTAAALTRKDIGDRVFPHFIAAHLPAGVSGLLVAAIFAAAMSTVSTSLNSSATLVMSDFYQRLISRNADDRQLMKVLHAATIAWGCLGTGMALFLVRVTESALDIWWPLSGVLGSGIIALFLLGVLVRAAGSRIAIASVAFGSAVIAWMVLSSSGLWPEDFAIPPSDMHPLLVIVVGTLVIVGSGFILSILAIMTSESSQN
ncbi:sodium:solute symporter [Neorhodopirellula pilleata]|uniref:Sodium/glucose cotransporter n=1 Tax=Neorhodopirellula pilleata TaxID=2714738 RepID=A0A5C6A6P6_9BACT|nr:sodium:solute symporter [Neorhodopirellula pilleata]TWT95055.1 Sodium/glucose cotransporter [Neorhodopirellula pilleata]